MANTHFTDDDFNPTLYARLGVASDAQHDEIKAAYKACANKMHPDKHTGSEGAFKSIQRAYEVLTKNRAEYDAQLGARMRNPDAARTGAREAKRPTSDMFNENADSQEMAENARRIMGWHKWDGVHDQAKLDDVYNQMSSGKTVPLSGTENVPFRERVLHAIAQQVLRL